MSLTYMGISLLISPLKVLQNFSECGVDISEFTPFYYSELTLPISVLAHALPRLPIGVPTP